MNETTRPWRVITVTKNDTAERDEAIVETLLSYELALSKFNHHRHSKINGQTPSVELRDPSNRCLLHTAYDILLDTPEDGLQDAQAGRYAYVFTEPEPSKSFDGRYIPLHA